MTFEFGSDKADFLPRPGTQRPCGASWRLNSAILAIQRRPAIAAENEGILARWPRALPCKAAQTFTGQPARGIFTISQEQDVVFGKHQMIVLLQYIFWRVKVVPGAGIEPATRGFSI